jgi:release factor glutamine methyltransferase
MLSQEGVWLLKEKYQGQKTPAFLIDLARLEAGEPLAFIIGSIPFLNTIISLDSRPLIPRTETEFWVEKAIKEIQIKQNGTDPINILDLCAGSGAIGVAVAKAIPNTRIDFIELDEKHLPTIKKNCELNKVAVERCRIFGGDLFTLTATTPLTKYDFILSNPPYIDPILDRTENSVKNFEPALALYGGVNGMELIEKIIKESKQHLNQHGQLWLEHEPEQSKSIEAAATGTYKVITHKDQYGQARFSQLVLQ